MLKTGLFLLCSVAILVSGADNEIDNGMITKTNTTTPDPTTPTTPAPTPTTTPAPSSTTTSAPTPTTTPAPTSTTTPAPTPTTTPAPAPTTTPAPTPTTTPAPTPTTTPAPPPTTTPAPGPSPTPVPEPATGKWFVNGTNETCIIAQMALQFNITYTTKDKKVASQLLDLPASNKTLARGTCGTAADLEQNITLTWNSTDPTALENSLTLHFVKNVTKGQYALHHLEVYLAPSQFPGINTTSTTFVHRTVEFTAALNNSYRCLKVQSVNLTNADKQAAGEIKISDLQFQAFHSEDTKTFGFAENCAFDTPDIVPIAVGCVLAVLVVIVLVVYLIGRRRSQARGYLSM